ncbi:hypothetical protein I6E29_01610 [Arcanobacterium haemolyticum]|nr:hypothetical protein [Arcanobacterium haemolyticum]
MIFLPSQEGYEDNFSHVATYDPEAARKVLDEAGWTEGSDGIREKNGTKLEIRYSLIGDSATGRNEASAFQQMLKEVGISLRIEERPSSDFSKILTTRDFDLFASSFIADTPFGVVGFADIYGSDGALNNPGIKNAELDAKIKDLATIADPGEHIAQANKLEVEALRGYGFIPLFNGPGMAAVQGGLANFAGNNGAGSMGFTTIPVENIGWLK